MDKTCSTCESLVKLISLEKQEKAQIMQDLKRAQDSIRDQEMKQYEDKIKLLSEELLSRDREIQNLKNDLLKLRSDQKNEIQVPPKNNDIQINQDKNQGQIRKPEQIIENKPMEKVLGKRGRKAREKQSTGSRIKKRNPETNNNSGQKIIQNANSNNARKRQVRRNIKVPRVKRAYRKRARSIAAEFYESKRDSNDSPFNQSRSSPENSLNIVSKPLIEFKVQNNDGTRLQCPSMSCNATRGLIQSLKQHVRETKGANGHEQVFCLKCDSVFFKPQDRIDHDKLDNCIEALINKPKAFLSTRQKEIVGSFSKFNPAKNEENGAPPNQESQIITKEENENDVKEQE